ncbi:uncharacterized protein Z519_03961 [Cladophialophora bantiana CBS 173.52]|uniref:Uncharacterized protein n=1 Tax=Cladophialophora bantiana (strain ATCC 10958 / CBS 173.52 / CDC B-1940 / NIH 8579) TaxID=1442370 RepID=A0A0D2G9U2_CLAB1|nr:uncharacterized protein Z519_03961 [Cladophialophora bantiana CBS 173.52]KIW95377.1 hypothetical protein Z519_03961 [Cladophialophora bantiana CBS 173.52]
MKRVKPFLKCLEIYAKSIDVLCNGTPFLPWIWISLSSQFISSFDKLMDAYVKIADALPRFDRYSKSIPQMDFHSILALVYADILEFHRRPYKGFFFSFFFFLGDASFELRLENILKNPAYDRVLVSKEATAFNIVKATSYRRKVEEQIAKAEQERESYRPFLLGFVWKTSIRRTTCSGWARNTLMALVTGSSTFPNTKLGSKTWIGVHYCGLLGSPAQGDISDKPSIFLRTLVMQITRIYPEVVALIWDTYVQNAQLASNDNLQKLLPDLISGAPLVGIVLNGIDEYEVKDCKLILDVLFKLQKKSPVAIPISSRDEGLISPKMRKKPRILFNDEQHTVQKDMSIFVASRLDQAIEDYDLNLSDEIKAAVEVNCMFLWVDLVMDCLQYAVSEDDFLRKIRELPEGLQAAYDRIVEKIMVIEDRLTRERMSRLLEWLAYSQITLSGDELLSALAKEPSSFDVRLSRPPNEKLLEFCNPLIDLSRSDSVDFVHFSAKE